MFKSFFCVVILHLKEWRGTNLPPGHKISNIIKVTTSNFYLNGLLSSSAKEKSDQCWLENGGLLSEF